MWFQDTGYNWLFWWRNISIILERLFFRYRTRRLRTLDIWNRSCFLILNLKRKKLFSLNLEILNSFKSLWSSTLNLYTYYNLFLLLLFFSFLISRIFFNIHAFIYASLFFVLILLLFGLFFYYSRVFNFEFFLTDCAYFTLSRWFLAQTSFRLRVTFVKRS